jgi:hypothetical protein
MPLTRKDFDVPPEPFNGDREKDDIHLAVGRALHTWEVVEHYLGTLYSTVLGAVVPVGALRAYGSISAFNVRQNMLNEAADALWQWAPNADLETDFKRVLNACNDAAARRAEIVHGLLIGENQGSEESFFLFPSFHSSRKRDFQQKPKYIYTSVEIETLRTKFNLLTSEITALERAIRDWRDASLERSRARSRL